MKLRLSEDLALPVDAATQTFLNVGKRGSGKSTTAARLVEQLLKAKVPVVVLDPVDTWWGLKASKDGGPGHDIYVFGGRHADLPLEPGGGALIADVLCEHHASMVLSVKHISGRARGTFMRDFIQTLFQKWTGGVLHLVLEEAHELAPQKPEADENEMLGAFKRIWKLGRSAGIGGTAITQRPASLHKDITTQAEILVVHRTIGPQDVEAVRQWIKYHQQGEEILGELATLKTGEAFVWAPEFPEEKPIGLKRVQMLPRETFDSSATPKHGETRVEPKALAEVDLERLRSKMAATIERQKAEDPKELRAKIRRLEGELKAAKAERSAITGSVTTRVREVGVIKDAQAKRLEAAARSLATLIEAGANRMDKIGQGIGRTRDEILAALQKARREGEPSSIGSRERAADRAVPARAAAAGRREPSVVPSGGLGAPAAQLSGRSNGSGHLTGPEQRILDALAWLESLGQTHPEETAVAFLAGYTIGGGAFNNPRGALRSKGLLEKNGDRLSLTAEGRGHARAPENALTAIEMQNRVRARLPGPERKLLDALLEAYPEPLTNEELAQRTDYSPDGGAFNNPRGRLRTLGLITYERGVARAAPVLFLEGA